MTIPEETAEQLAEVSEEFDHLDDVIVEAKGQFDDVKENVTCQETSEITQNGEVVEEISQVTREVIEETVEVAHEVSDVIDEVDQVEGYKLQTSFRIFRIFIRKIWNIQRQKL